MSYDGLCFLSLDGGGVRGLSTLYILREIMAALNHAREEAGLLAVKRCDVFGLIGGTSTGGLIAIMLGRLGMDVDDCISAYNALIEAIFTEREIRTGLGFKGNVEAKFSSQKLRECIENPGVSRGCRVFVCSCDRNNTRRIIRLRSYDIPGKPRSMNRPSVVQVALATSAAPRLFDEVNIGDVVHLDGGLDANNPVNHVAHEASDILCKEGGDPNLQARIKCFLSIGTGHPGVKAVHLDNAWKHISATLKEMVTDTQKDAHEFAHSWRRPLSQGRYFRFNVRHGLYDISLHGYKEKGKVETMTLSYLEEQDAEQSVRKCVKAMENKECVSIPDFS
ncbi:ankyrin repeat protein [Paraphaeosphaeria sporulosa]